MKDPNWPALTLGLDAILQESANPEAALEQLRAAVYRCRRCALHRSKTNYVFGAGNPRSPVMFVGEAPGAEEDRLGKPFVGRAGERLTRALETLGWTRESHVYIANTLKCRPPNNRDPRPEEIRACSPYLDAQIRIIRPRVLVALGRFAAHFLLDIPMERMKLGRLRGRLHDSRYGVPVLVTYHPAATLRRQETYQSFLDDLRFLQDWMEGRDVA